MVMEAQSVGLAEPRPHPTGKVSFENLEHLLRKCLFCTCGASALNSAHDRLNTRLDNPGPHRESEHRLILRSVLTR